MPITFTVVIEEKGPGTVLIDMHCPPQRASAYERSTAKLLQAYLDKFQPPPDYATAIDLPNTKNS